MTEPIFKAPLPPEGNDFSQPTKAEPVASVPEGPKQKIMQYLWYILGGTFVLGLILGMALTGGGDSAPAAPSCKLRAVTNADIQKRFPLCGASGSSKADPCVLYIVNHTQFDKAAKDYFVEAGRLTGRNSYAISFENPTYSEMPIPPGWFAEIKIPSQR